MRTAKVSCALLLLLEASLALVFLAGFAWWGGWRAGLLCSVTLLVLVCLPWLGSLELDYDSGPGRLRVVLSWWGTLTAVGKPATPRLRILGIPVRLRRRNPSPATAASPPPSAALAALEQPAPDTSPMDQAREAAVWAGENLDPVARLLLAALQAGHGLVWSAREMQVRLQSPLQHEWIDAALASIARERQLGPVKLLCTVGPTRRVRVHYRAAMLSAGLLYLSFLVEGRPSGLIAAWKRERGQDAGL